MTKLFNLPLKVLWVYNCNEADIAIDFLLEEGGKKYQVLGSGLDAFFSDKKLKICTVDNINNTYPRKPNSPVYIEDGSRLTKIWNYWKKESGEKRYSNLLEQFDKYHKAKSEQIFRKEGSPKNLNGELKELNPKQIFDLTFEIRTLIDIQKGLKGYITKDEIELLLKFSASGFNEKTVEQIREELRKKGVF